MSSKCMQNSRAQSLGPPAPRSSHTREGGPGGKFAKSPPNVQESSSELAEHEREAFRAQSLGPPAPRSSHTREGGPGGKFAVEEKLYELADYVNKMKVKREVSEKLKKESEESTETGEGRRMIRERKVGEEQEEEKMDKRYKEMMEEHDTAGELLHKAAVVKLKAEHEELVEKAAEKLVEIERFEAEYEAMRAATRL
jgi:hypothetical protein